MYEIVPLASILDLADILKVQNPYVVHFVCIFEYFERKNENQIFFAVLDRCGISKTYLYKLLFNFGSATQTNKRLHVFLVKDSPLGRVRLKKTSKMCLFGQNKDIPIAKN